MKRQGVKFSSDTYLLAVAICYKLVRTHSVKELLLGFFNTRKMNIGNILLQVATGDLEDLVQRLKKASESSVSSFVKKPEFCMEVLATAREKLEDIPTLHVQFEEIVAKLQASGQIISQTLDDLLCQPPRTKRRPMQLLKLNQISRRTLKPIHSALLAE
uniref:Pentatricopeptide repeat domain 2 n=1 Tax=Podarcis muralis TaxID=64176 RepID=A0A670IY35_PODMU